jgi:hypothetical protein
MDNKNNSDLIELAEILIKTAMHKHWKFPDNFRGEQFVIDTYGSIIPLLRNKDVFRLLPTLDTMTLKKIIGYHIILYKYNRRSI